MFGQILGKKLQFFQHESSLSPAHWLDVLQLSYKRLVAQLMTNIVIKKSLYTSLGAHQAGAYPGFSSMKRLGVLLLPPGWDASPSQGYPQQ